MCPCSFYTSNLDSIAGWELSSLYTFILPSTLIFPLLAHSGSSQILYFKKLPNYSLKQNKQKVIGFKKKKNNLLTLVSCTEKLIYVLNQGLGKFGLWAESRLFFVCLFHFFFFFLQIKEPFFVIKFLLEHSHTYLFS